MSSHANSIETVSTSKPPLSLRLEPKLAREFRVEAAKRDMRLNELFEEMWQLYKDTQHGAV